MRIILKVTAGPLAGRLFRFSGHDTFLIGRSKHTHLQLPTSDRTCSRIHFMIEFNPPHCRLMDMGSNNGTYVNDQRVSVVDLKHGDKIRAGRNLLRIAIQTATKDAEPPPSEAMPPPLPLELTTDLPAAIPLSHVLPAEACPLGIPVPVSQPSMPPVVAPPPLAVESPPAPLPPTVSLVVPVAVETAAAPTALPDPHATATVAESTAEERIAGYRLVRKLGQGGMGVVYLAVKADGQCSALKLMRPTVKATRTEIERFVREAKILRDLQHPHIVNFHDVGECDGYFYFAMDYVAGRDAGALVKQHGPLPAGRAVPLACQLLEALEYAHGKRFVHRDIKPSNLLVYDNGGRECVKLADFGLARVYQDSKLSGLTMDGDIGGSPCFMAPEQLLNFRDAPPSADQYSAAATLYYLLTAKYVYDMPKDLHLIFAKILNEDPVPLRKRRPDVPAALAEVIHRALRREVNKRFENVQLFRLALEAVPLGG